MQGGGGKGKEQQKRRQFFMHNTPEHRGCIIGVSSRVASRNFARGSTNK
jgi:hypothetical protein